MKRLWLPLLSIVLVAGWWVTADAGRSSTPPLERAVAADSTRTTSAPAGTAPKAAVPATTLTSLTTSSAAPAPILAPPFGVSTMTLSLVDTTRPTVSKGHLLSASRRLTTLVWSPEAPGRWPLVVFAHGFSVGPTPYEHLCRAWAAAGYVVAAPRFPLTDESVAGAALDVGDLANQPAEVGFVVRALTAPTAPVAPKIDAGRVAVAGHSDGAETALAAAAAAPSFRAVIAMSGGPVGSGRNPALLAIQGDADPINPPADGYAVFQQASAPRFLLRLLGGGHLPPFDGTTAYQPVVERVTVDFLDRFVAGSGSSSAALLGDARPPLAAIEGTP